MVRVFKIIILLLCFQLENENIFAQAKKEYKKKEEIMVDGKRYRVHNSYFTFGGGPVLGSTNSDLKFDGGIDFNFPIKVAHLQLGGMISGPSFGNNKMIQMHLGAGKRFELIKWNLAGFGGISYSTGYYKKVYNDTLLVINAFNTAGLYACAHAYYKLKYDIGIGIALFGDFNPYQYMFGARFELYFSGAYRGQKRGAKVKTAPPTEEKRED